jgi:hypothetical protein
MPVSELEKNADKKISKNSMPNKIDKGISFKEVLVAWLVLSVFAG